MSIKFEEIVVATVVTFKILESLEKGALVEIPELRTSIFEKPKEI